jgi:hypothetical protein
MARSEKAFITVEGAGHLAMGLRLAETVRWMAQHLASASALEAGAAP